MLFPLSNLRIRSARSPFSSCSTLPQESGFDVPGLTSRLPTSAGKRWLKTRARQNELTLLDARSRRHLTSAVFVPKVAGCRFQWKEKNLSRKSTETGRLGPVSSDRTSNVEYLLQSEDEDNEWAVKHSSPPCRNLL